MHSSVRVGGEASRLPTLIRAQPRRLLKLTYENGLRLTKAMKKDKGDYSLACFSTNS
jgi:hypothetical protein